MNKFAFVDCVTVDEALGQLDNGSIIKAGGIDLLVVEDFVLDRAGIPPSISATSPPFTGLQSARMACISGRCRP